MTFQTPEEYQHLVQNLAKPATAIQSEITAKQLHLVHMVLGISGEAGELLDAVKKNAIYQKPLDRNNIIEELGDLEFYMEGLRQGLDISRNEVLDHNITKLRKRYGQSYSNEAAIVRADKSE